MTTANGHRCLVCGGSLTRSHDTNACLSCGMEYYTRPLSRIQRSSDEFIQHCWLLMQRMAQKGMSRTAQVDALHDAYGIDKNFTYYRIIPEDAKGDFGPRDKPRQRITIHTPLMPGWEIVTTLVVEKTEYKEAPCSG